MEKSTHDVTSRESTSPSPSRPSANHRPAFASATCAALGGAATRRVLAALPGVNSAVAGQKAVTSPTARSPRTVVAWTNFALRWGRVCAGVLHNFRARKIGFDSHFLGSVVVFSSVVASFRGDQVGVSVVIPAQ